MMKKIRWLWVTLIGCLLLILISGYVAIFTHIGLVGLIKLSETVVPGVLRIEESKGTLNSTVSIKNLTYYYQGNVLSIDHLEFDYRLKKWFTQRLFKFNKLHLSQVKLVIAKNSNTNQTFQIQQIIDYFQQVKNIAIDDINIQHVFIQYGSETKFIDSIVIVKSAQNNYALSIHSSQGQLLGNMQVIRKPVFSWAIYLTASHLRIDGLASGLTGEIGFILNTRGQWEKTFKQIMLSIDKLSGNIRNFPFNGAVDLEMQNDEWLIKKARLFLGNASLQMTGKSTATQTDLDWAIHIPQLSKLYAGYQGSFLFSGKFFIKNGVYQGSSILKGEQIKTPLWSVSHIDGKIIAMKPKEISQARLNLFLKNIRIKEYIIPKITLNATTEVNKSTLLSSFVLALNPFNQLRGKVTLPQFQSTFDQPLDGEITIHFSNLKSLLLTRYVKNLKGKLEGNLHLSGQLNKPQFSGNINAVNGQCFLPQLGITPHAINLNASIHQFQPIKLIGAISSGQGRAALSGWVNILQEGWPFNLQIKGNNFTLVKLNNYQIHFSPDLIWQRNNNYFNIQGSATFPFVEIITDQYSNAITLPDEVIFVHKKSKILPISKNLTLHVRVLLGKHVFVAAKNLRARLGGDILVTQLLGGMPIGTGELNVTEGSYKVYNQTLTINHGRLIYLGNLLSNPGLTMRAFKTIKPSGWNLFAGTEGSQSTRGNIRVGALVQGTMDNPQITLISYPPMKQDDILSYLIFGSPTEQLTGSNSLSLLAGVASHLNLLNPNMSDGSDTTTGSTLLGGLQMGWFNPTQVVNFRRQITDRWMLQTQASMVETGADFLYEYKHD